MPVLKASSSSPPVAAGLGTKVGLSSSAVLFVLAVVAYVQGDRSEQTLGTIAAGGASVAILLATILSRGIQAAFAALGAGGLDVDALEAALERIGAETREASAIASTAATRADSANARVTGIRELAEVDDAKERDVERVSPVAGFFEDVDADDLVPLVGGGSVAIARDDVDELPLTADEDLDRVEVGFVMPGDRDADLAEGEACAAAAPAPKGGESA